MGKGSGARPFSVSKEEYDNRFDNIFRKNRNETGNTTTRQDQGDRANDPGSSTPASTDSNQSRGVIENDSTTSKTNN